MVRTKLSLILRALLAGALALAGVLAAAPTPANAFGASSPPITSGAKMIESLSISPASRNDPATAEPPSTSTL